MVTSKGFELNQTNFDTPSSCFGANVKEAMLLLSFKDTSSQKPYPSKNSACKEPLNNHTLLSLSQCIKSDNTLTGPLNVNK